MKNKKNTRVPNRVLLKLSGEQFAGENTFGIDATFLDWLACEIKKVVMKTGCQIIIVVGGGNFLRGATLSAGDSVIDRTDADYMGMLATIMNGMALENTLKYHEQETRLQTKIPISPVAEPFIRKKAIRHLEKGRVVIVGGGTGNPFVTTDTAAVSVALELDCAMVLKATKVDGIYTADPKKDPNASKIPTLTYLEALNNENINVMDSAALSMAMENKMPLVVFDLLTPDNIWRVINGDSVGTRVQ